MATRLSVRSKYSNLNGGYSASGTHDGKPVYQRETKTGESQTCLFHESKFGGKHWYFGASLPRGGTINYLIHSSSDGASPDKATWPHDDIEAIEDATHARDHRKDEEALFHDPEFPHSRSSIGLSADSFTPQWIAVRFLRRGRWKLFDGIGPQDLLQGGLGNCWLVAALAAMAEFPKEVQKLFVDADDMSRSGRYTIRLFDYKQDQMRDIIIDEFVPCHPKSWWDAYGTPLFARPNGNEAWVLLLEKAMAKMFGSYSALDGNNAAVAFRALTGVKNTFMWKKDDEGTWTKWLLANRSTSFQCNPVRAERTGDDGLFAQLVTCDKSNFLMSASMKVVHAMEHRRKDGLVEGHAYSLLQVLQKEGQKLLCMRNPWGNDVQWKGAWSDGDAMWTKFPSLRRELRPEFEADGIFWMCWGDFKTRWDSVVVCAKTMREGEAAEAHSVGRIDPGLSSFRDPSFPTRPPPLGSLSLPVTTGDPLNCPGKHGLAQTRGHFVCNLCHRHTGVLSDVYSCRTCDYDICGRCVARAPAGYEKAHASPSDSPGMNPLAGAAGAGAGTSPGEVSCRGKHELTLDEVGKGFMCNVCRRQIRTGSRAWSCRICDFDACLSCCSKGSASADAIGKDPGEAKGDASGKGKGYPDSAGKGKGSADTSGKRPCARGCGRPAFDKFPTCCNRCHGKDGPHAMDCAAKAGLPSADTDAHEADKTGAEAAVRDLLRKVGLDPEILKFDSIRVHSDVVGDMNPCRNGCGRPAFGKFPTCCTHCKGPDGPHARDCEVKAGLAV